MAISKIGSKALVDCSVAAVDIADNSITAAKLAGSIANAKLANSSITVNGSTVSLGASGTIPAVSWQSVITADGSTATSAVAGQGYFIDTTSNAHTINLPGSPSAGDTIAIKDYAGTFATNNLTIGRNGNNIQGVANNSLISTNRASLTLVYVDATKGWLYAVESNVADLQEALFVTATGGTITTSGDFKIHTFTGDGCFVVSDAGNSAGSDSVDYLVVAGGGGGGSNHGGGGGAGLADQKAGGVHGADQGRGPGAAIKHFGLADGESQNQVIEHPGIPFLVRQPALARFGTEGDRVLVGQGSLPTDERRAVISAVRNKGLGQHGFYPPVGFRFLSFRF